MYGFFIYDIKVIGLVKIMKLEKNVENCFWCDGDVILIFFFSNIWIDYCYFLNVVDGLIDVICGLNSIFIINCYFIRYNKVMFLGGDVSYIMDWNMYVIVVYNKFGFGFV